MAELRIDVDGDRINFRIEGDVGPLASNPRIKLYLRGLEADLHEPNCIKIPIKDQTLESLYAKIVELLTRFGHSVQQSAAVSEHLANYLAAERDFSVFSNKAKAIWDNKIETDEFKVFAESVHSDMPGRGLYPLQLLAAFHLGFAQNACNFSVPGAGKTSVVLAAFAYLNSLPPDDPKYVNKIVVVGPLSSFGPWELEFRECFGRAPRSARLSSATSPAMRDRYLFSTLGVDETPELLLMSYQSVSRISSGLEYFFKRRDHRVMMVLDEAHRIKKTDEGVWAEAVLRLAPLCRSRVVLTGTPVPNGYQDLVNLFKFIWPNKNIPGYRVHQLADMSANPGDERIPALVNNIAPFFVRITKAQLNIPPPIENPPLVVKMGERQAEIYDFIEKSYMGYFQQLASNKNVRDVFARARLIRLMQAATNPALLTAPIDEIAGSDAAGANLFIDDSGMIEKIRAYKNQEIPTKYIAVGNLVEEILSRGSDEKVVVWGTFVQTLFDFQAYLKKRGIESRLLFGGTPIDGEDQSDESDTREKIISQFHAKDSPYRVIIANPMAVGESISLHHACHNAIYLERTFNAGIFLQSKDRIHRYGLQPDDRINYYYAVSESTVDVAIHRRLLEKERVMLALIESQQIPLINMNSDYEVDSENDIKAIIRDYVAKSRTT